MDLLLIIALSVGSWLLFLILAEIGERTKRSKSVRFQLDK